MLMKGVCILTQLVVGPPCTCLMRAYQRLKQTRQVFPHPITMTASIRVTTFLLFFPNNQRGFSPTPHIILLYCTVDLTVPDIMYSVSSAFLYQNTITHKHLTFGTSFQVLQSLYYIYTVLYIYIYCTLVVLLFTFFFLRQNFSNTKAQIYLCIGSRIGSMFCITDLSLTFSFSLNLILVKGKNSN